MIYNDPNNAPFYVGQEVVRLVDETYGLLKRGKKYEVLKISFCCKIWGWRIDVGVYDEVIPNCVNCEKVHHDGCLWAAKNFAPIEKQKFTNAIEELIVLPVEERLDVKPVKQPQTI